MSSDPRREERTMDRRRRWIAGGALALAVVGATTGFAIASAGDDDRPLTGSALDRATSAALAHTGGGTVIESEVGDDGAAYGVEIRLDDGRVVEVALDANFEVIGDATDDDGTTGSDDDGVGDD
jgi:uncharacterized membrane protein YkoI